MEQCKECKYAVWDYEDYYGDGRQYFVTDCRKDLPEPEGECEEWSLQEEYM